MAVVATALTMVETDNNQQKAAVGAAKMEVVVAAKAVRRWLWWWLKMKRGSGVLNLCTIFVVNVKVV